MNNLNLKWYHWLGMGMSLALGTLLVWLATKHLGVVAFTDLAILIGCQDWLIERKQKDDK